MKAVKVRMYQAYKVVFDGGKVFLEAAKGDKVDPCSIYLTPIDEGIMVATRTARASLNYLVGWKARASEYSKRPYWLTWVMASFA